MNACLPSARERKVGRQRCWMLVECVGERDMVGAKWRLIRVAAARSESVENVFMNGVLAIPICERHVERLRNTVGVRDTPADVGDLNGLRAQKFLVLEAPLYLEAIWAVVGAKRPWNEIALATRRTTNGSKRYHVVASVGINFVAVGWWIAQVPDSVDAKDDKEETDDQY